MLPVEDFGYGCVFLYRELLVPSLSVDRFLSRRRCFDADSSVSGFPIDARTLFLFSFPLFTFHFDV